MSAHLQPFHTVVRPMTRSDLDMVFTIETNAHLCPWTEKNFLDCLDAEYACRIAGNAEETRGFSILTMAAGEAHLLNICVDPEYQNIGIGQLLLSDAIAQSLENDISMFFLEVRPSNQTAINLYLKNGFNEIGRRINYYPTKKGREDAVIYAKSLQKAI